MPRTQTHAQPLWKIASTKENLRFFLLKFLVCPPFSQNKNKARLSARHTRANFDPPKLTFHTPQYLCLSGLLFLQVCTELERKKNQIPDSLDFCELSRKTASLELTRASGERTTANLDQDRCPISPLTFRRAHAPPEYLCWRWRRRNTPEILLDILDSSDVFKSQIEYGWSPVERHIKGTRKSDRCHF